MDFYHLRIHRLVYGSVLRRCGPRNICQPRILKRTLLSDLRLRGGDCCRRIDTVKGQSADFVCRVFSFDITARVHNRIYPGKSISQQMVGLQ